MITYIRSFNILNEVELSWLEDLPTKILKKGEFLIQEGATCQEIVFLKSGILRSFYINNEGEEITICIAFERELMSAYSSFITQRPTHENIQAIADTELVILKKKDMDGFYLKSQNWNIFGRHLTELYYVELEKRVVSFQKHSAKERYEMLLSTQARYIRLIPLQYLSSFLGITSRHLSRLRKTT